MYRLRLTLRELRLSDDPEARWLRSGRARFLCRVTPGGDEARSRETRLPTVGSYPTLPLRRALEREVFDGPLEADDRLELTLARLAPDGRLATGEEARYHRAFKGDPASWAGSYEPAEGPGLGVAFRIEVEAMEGAEADDPFADWGQQRFHQRFLDQRRDAEGRFDPQLWQRGLAQKAALRRADPAADDPGPQDLRGEARAFCRLEGGGEVPVEPAEHPAPDVAFADPKRIVRVVGEKRLGEAVLSVGLEVEELAGIDPESLHLFRWDERRGAFRRVERSGLGGDGSYVWGRLGEPGIYGVFGLPSDRARRDTAALAHQLRSWGRLADVAGHGDLLLDRLCALILCPGVFAGELEDPRLLEGFGLGDEIGRDLGRYGDPLRDPKGRPIGPQPLISPGPGRFGGDLCERCTGVGGGGLHGPEGPEGQLGGGGAACEVWTSYGPSNFGGRVKALAWHPQLSHVVYAGNSQGGVFRSLDGGRRWTPTMEGELSLAIGALAIAPSAPGVLYAGTGEYGGWYQVGVGIYKSTDGGDDWDLLNTPANTRFSRIAVHPGDPDRLCAAGDAGVERSFDGGLSWELILSGSVSDVLLDPTDSDVLYAGCEDARGLRRLDDAWAANVAPGDWTAINGGLTLGALDGGVNFAKLAATTSAAGALSLWCQVNRNRGGNPSVYRWNGAGWDLRLDSPDGTYGDWCSVVAVEPGNPQVVYSGGTAMRRTVDGGANWVDLAHLGHADEHAIAFDPNRPRRILVGNDGGVFRHERNPADPEDRNLLDFNHGHRTIQFLNLAVSREGRFLVAGSTQDQGVLASRVGTRWDGIGGGEWGPVEVFAKDGHVVMWDPHDGAQPNLQRSEDGGRTRRDADNGLGGRWVNQVAMHPEDSLVALVTTPAQGGNPAAVWRSEDGGAPAPAAGFQLAAELDANAGDVVFAPSDPEVAWLVLHDGEVLRSGDGGRSWQSIGQGPGGGRAIASVTVDWDDPERIYVTYRGVGFRHVHLRDGAGAAWRDVSGAVPWGSLPDVPAHRLAIDSRDSERLYVATDVGVFRSSDGGDSWYPFDEGLPNAIVTDLAYRPVSQRLYVSTFGRGAYQRKI